MRARDTLKELFETHEPDGSCQAGQNLGMSIEAVVETYFGSRNSILKLLRLSRGLTLQEVAAEANIEETELKEIEESNELLPPQIVVKLANVLRIDLKVLLVVLGLAREEILDERKGEQGEFLMAAQYSGPELDKQDKVNLEEVFRRILRERNARSKRQNEK